MAFRGFAGCFQDDVLVLGADGLPYLGAHDHYVGNHGVLVCGIYLADFAMFAGGKCCFIVLSAVNNAGLERGIYIAVGHGYRDSA